MPKKYVYFFGGGKAEGNKDMKLILGGKGANLAEMSNLGIRVPPGFTITAEVCNLYYENNEQYPEGLDEQVNENLKKLEDIMGLKFGDPDKPLLVSVRSGAAISMPGMMDTVLNIGLNDKTVKGLISKFGDARPAYDAYRRLVQMFGNVVLGIDSEKFEERLNAKKEAKGVEYDIELEADDLKELVGEFKEIVKKETGKEFPDDPREQIQMAIDAVFGSWNNQRAITYRRINNIPNDLGTAVNIQAMVFGNTGEKSATGVAFSRNPSTGENKFYGEFLVNAQGEDVVAGIRTPQSIDELANVLTEAYKELADVNQKLEKHYKDTQDMEFTIQDGTLYLLQTRTGKRTGTAAVKIAVDMVKEGLIDKETAVSRVTPDALDQLLHPMIDPNIDKDSLTILAKGLNASPGAAVGKVVFTAEEAEKWVEDGKKVVLVRDETSPEDIGGMHVSEGILTARGGMTSHAAVVARGMGTPCVAGCGDIRIDYDAKQFRANNTIVKEGDFITIDGTTGEVILGEVDLVEPKLSGEFGELMEWVDEIKKIGVRTNADTPHDAQVARDYGAVGIGLCRTEHMFFGGNRIDAMREMILANDEEGRRKALDKLLPYQKQDFIEIFKVMEGLPVIIRTLDPPLHEFLPHEKEQIEDLAEKIGVDVSVLEDRIASLKEANPMLGHRGCRLGIAYPEITEMQARAIFEAAVEVTKEGKKVIPEVMIPLVGFVEELKRQKAIVDKVADEVMKKAGIEIDYMVGTMIELPRAALTADEIAKEAQFFSFGTNDLTQTTLGVSRDDAQGTFLRSYMEDGVLESDPFQTLDQTGVGQLIEMATKKGRKSNPELEVGICGEHGGDPESVKFCHRVGLDYVSCSPPRVPIARLAAAHAVIEEKSK